MGQALQLKGLVCGPFQARIRVVLAALLNETNEGFDDV